MTKTPPKSGRDRYEAQEGRRIDTRQIMLGDLFIPPAERIREFSEAVVEEKMASMSSPLGQLSPIIVRADGGGYELIAGLHRLEAARRLGWPDIRADIWECSDSLAWLLQLDDNLASTKLTTLDLALSLHERKEIYEREHPETRKGVAGALAGGRGRPKIANEIISLASSGGQKRQSEIISFCQVVAKQLGKSKRHVEMMIDIGARASQEYQGVSWAQHMRGTSAATHFVEAREFFNDKQNTDALRLEILKDLRSGTPSKSVRAARNKSVGMDRRSLDDVAYQGLATKFMAASPRVREAFFYLCAKGEWAEPMREALERAEAPGSPDPQLLLNPLEPPKKLEAAPKLLPAASPKKKG